MNVPPPYYPYPLPAKAPEVAQEPEPTPTQTPGSAARPLRRRRRQRPRWRHRLGWRPRLRVPWVLVDDAFWTGVLTAVSIAGLVAVVIATT